MKQKKLFLTVLIAAYLLALWINFMPALMHPDLNMNSLNLFVSTLFAIMLLLYSTRGSKKLIIFSIVGTLSGVLIFTINTFEYILMDKLVLDAIASLQYLLYPIFTIPFFGGNLLFNVNYATYSVFLSLFYVVVLGLSIYYKKRRNEFVK